MKRMVVVADLREAEIRRTELYDGFLEKFGIEVLQGYGLKKEYRVIPSERSQNRLNGQFGRVKWRKSG